MIFPAPGPSVSCVLLPLEFWGSKWEGDLIIGTDGIVLPRSWRGLGAGDDVGGQVLVSPRKG